MPCEGGEKTLKEGNKEKISLHLENPAYSFKLSAMDEISFNPGRKINKSPRSCEGIFWSISLKIFKYGSGFGGWKEDLQDDAVATENGILAFIRSW